VDGRLIGRTPASIELLPGDHLVEVRRGPTVLHEETVTARFGRAIIVDSEAGRLEENADAAAPAQHFSGSAEVGFMGSRLGSFVGPVHPAGRLFVGYVLHDGERVSFVLGLRTSLTFDTWGNAVGGGTTACPMSTRFEGTALSAFLDGSVGFHPTPRVRIDADVGFGLGGYFASPVGGDLFVPSCTPAPGVVPALEVGAAVSYAFTRNVRGVVAPLWFEAQPAFYGARSSPIDASGPWLRLGSGLGVAVDL
jgi:hypothetical protein